MFLLIFLIHVQIGCSKRPYLPNTGSKFKLAKEMFHQDLKKKLTITRGKHSSKYGTKMKTTLFCSVVSPIQQKVPIKTKPSISTGSGQTRLPFLLHKANKYEKQKRKKREKEFGYRSWRQWSSAPLSLRVHSLFLSLSVSYTQVVEQLWIQGFACEIGSAVSLRGR